MTQGIHEDGQSFANQDPILAIHVVGMLQHLYSYLVSLAQNAAQGELTPQSRDEAAARYP